MLSFLKNLMGNKPTAKEVQEQVQEESILSASDTAQSHQEENQVQDASSGVITTLSLHKSWEDKLSPQEKYSLSFMAQELTPLQAGNISLAGTALVPHDEGIEVTAFIRNSSDEPVQLNETTLVVLFGDQELFTRQTFDMSEIGEIPPRSARPWSFVFDREHFLKVDVLLANWKIAFELAEKKMVLPHQLELEESWIKALSEEQKTYLIQLAKNLPALKEGEVNIQSVQLGRSSEGDLHVMLLIRNGSGQSLSLEKLPLALFDASGDKVAEGLFELDGLIVHANTSKPWVFIFPPASFQKEAPDLSRWKVSVPQGA
ncbi:MULTISPECIES: accessory Sec system S-layer assembly protein [unclassified Brevibacillus]|uniref:accessory Sec system S-layer assembly protein n=1 Tax=unclassified Brevibacillus TaxID=2684853 RepID=UPI0006FB7A75|nr:MULTISPECIES: accessory Sec system S-layer assembly protein [unclassified Brevibacillus]NRR19231.1 accessory Sec system S-layer assembly protein [Brevibacillus sp. MS2.2]RAT98737.1 accessory Sec system S-layer assembly protein [Brevibacillus sp. Leaf182]